MIISVHLSFSLYVGSRTVAQCLLQNRTHDDNDHPDDAEAVDGYALDDRVPRKTGDDFRHDQQREYHQSAGVRDRPGQTEHNDEPTEGGDAVPPSVTTV